MLSSSFVNYRVNKHGEALAGEPQCAFSVRVIEEDSVDDLKDAIKAKKSSMRC
ncbi:hypothetical protein PC116_g18810 [Phytophthora cactorum]|uniref:Crinkler effector protein N-terminal domain-containing protein n=1 Tax=Phytophthora cactorum TaxID=29920 RepID=A0A8T1K8J0_9STRA|nr:hypothetical protein PC114_g15954 [Phytophthora cactorum]KAG2921305.1 hypothetical protein PC117_g16275 [Phytophthora cactorum]KAG3004578.1 hypothetical protein PC119_g15580 [Phytophthora cactorum]KAG3011524.1 hypothetical protein PC120_g14372 [Phytophthora cactorum]KAG3151453.1 hypothetical protein C6341_g16547 [Phytophthora cactorum]